MATPPTFVAEYETAWDGTGTDTVSVTIADGDLLVEVSATADTAATPGVPTGGTGVTWTAAQFSNTASKCSIRSQTSTGAAAQTFTLSQAYTGSGPVNGATCLRFSGSDGVGASNKAEGSGTGPAVDLTTEADNSAVVVIASDWAAGNGARTWRTVNGYTPAAGNGEYTYAYVSGQYTVYVAVYPDVGAAGTNSYGLSAPTQNWTIHAIEVLGDAGGVAREPIPVDLAAAGTWVAATVATSVSLAYPTNNADELLTALLFVKPDTAAIGLPADWTNAGAFVVGSGTQGAGTGALRGGLRFRVSPGDLTGNQSFSFSSSPSSSAGVMHAWSYDDTGYTDPQWSTPAGVRFTRTTASQTFGGTASATLDLAAGDVVLIHVISRDDESNTHTISGISVPGCTLGTVTQAPAGAITNSLGNDLSGSCAYAQVLTGTASGAPSATVTLNTSESGGIIFWRIRATGIPVTTPEGAGTGTTSWSGSSTGARASSGTSTGSLGWTGSASGTRVSSGAGTGATTWGGSAAGKSPNRGVATGTLTWGGEAYGLTSRAGSATGSTSWTGAAAGAHTSSGIGTGSTTWTGAATGTRASQGLGTGSVAWSGAATGEAPMLTPKGSGTGSTAWTGTAQGATGYRGSASGTVTWLGSAVGHAARSGAWVGTTTWVGASSGATVKRGAASGAISWTGAASGEAPSLLPHEGAGAGTTAWTGSAAGASTRSGSGSGATVWTGGALGRAAHLGVALGDVSWAGVSEGHATHSGAGAGDVSWTGVAEGARVSRGASAPGTLEWVGLAVGHLDAHGAALGIILRVGTAEGHAGLPPPPELGYAHAEGYLSTLAAGGAVRAAVAVLPGLPGWDGASVVVLVYAQGPVGRVHAAGPIETVTTEGTLLP